MTQPVIQLKNINKFFELFKDYKVQALNQINLDIYSQSVIGLTGPSGSGKSTLLNIIGLIDIDFQGNFNIEGKSIENKSQSEITKIRREKIGFIFQHFSLIPVLSAFANVEYPLIILNYDKKKRRAKVEELMVKLGLKDQMHKTPNQMSGGQKQRVAIARAIVKKPLFIIADEPTASLDSKNSEIVFETLKNLAIENNSIVILASHEYPVLEQCDTIIQMVDGKINPKQIEV